MFFYRCKYSLKNINFIKKKFLSFNMSKPEPASWVNGSGVWWDFLFFSTSIVKNPFLMNLSLMSYCSFLFVLFYLIFDVLNCPNFFLVMKRGRTKFFWSEELSYNYVSIVIALAPFCIWSQSKKCLRVRRAYSLSILHVTGHVVKERLFWLWCWKFYHFLRYFYGNNMWSFMLTHCLIELFWE